MNTNKEIWMDFPEYENEYQGSNLGNIRSIKNGKIRILKPVRYNNDREMVSLCCNGKVKPVLVHKFIWSCFNGPIREGYDIHHKDFNCHNNRIENLQMLSKEEHRLIHGNYKKKIECFDLDGNFVAEYDSIYQAAKRVGHRKYACNICECCKGNRKSAYGYIWKYKK